MSTVNEIMKSASLLGACGKSGGVSDWKSLAWLFFTPQGREFCEKHNFPSLEMFRQIKDSVAPYGVWVDAGRVVGANDENIALIGDTTAELTYSGVECTHKVVLMHGAKVRIKASNYAVLLIVNVGGCEVEIDKDETVVVL